MSVLPIIKNASDLRLKILALQPEESLEVTRAMVPKSYKSPIPLLTRIQKQYGLYFSIFRLADSPGWQVTRVNTAEEAANAVPQRRRTQSAGGDEPVRNYHLTDAELFVLIEKKLAMARRDIAQMTPRGITAGLLNTLESDALAFAALPGDDYWQATEGSATDKKDDARDTLQTRLGNLRNMADNTFGSGSVVYRAFRFEGMAGEEDARLVRTARRAWREGTLNQTALEPWGCTVGFLNQLKDDIDAFDLAMDDQETVKTDRLKATAQRIATGNDLYSRLEKICTTGKDIFRTTSQAKYNDYLIYG